MSLMQDETREAPDAVARCLAQSTQFATLGAELRSLDPPFAVVAARGSSAHAGTFLRALLGLRLGLVAAAAMPSLASVYGQNPRMRGALFVALSQSGRSPDLIAATHAARAGGALTLAIVNDTASPLASACDHVLDLRAGPERSVAATKTVLASLAGGLALVDAWDGQSSQTAELPGRIAAALALDWSPLVTLLSSHDRLFTLGRGPGLGIAQEAALKLAETCTIGAMAFSMAEIAHGPVTLGYPALAFLQHDETHQRSMEFLAASGLRVIATGRDLPTLPAANPAADLLPMLGSFYLAAEAAARARGLDPDRPRSLTKITQTT